MAEKIPPTDPEKIPLLSAAQTQPRYDRSAQDDDEGDLNRDFPPISPLPTPPPKKPSTTTTANNDPSQITNEKQFAPAVKQRRPNYPPPPAPGLSSISVGPMAFEHPPLRSQNIRLNQAFRELARKDLEEKERKKTLDRLNEAARRKSTGGLGWLWRDR
ncbi:hypothetical protein PRZ48_005871 [Zasmidium cellare]|uniref:Uncharacterized protein n=1 Tax=Zasmidium cellare TaxID=395010 RepID=A0ABR0EMR3_ZASCE|nr:hypothetical protein PRZ48_005871 [Zasmidium cellare]